MAAPGATTIRVLCATVNAGNARPPEDLSPWIPRGGVGYDIIAVASQECTWGAGAKKKEDDEDDGDLADTPAVSGDAPVSEAHVGVTVSDSGATPHPVSSPHPPPLASASCGGAAEAHYFTSSRGMPSLEAARSGHGFLAAARATAAEGLAGGGLLGAISSTASFLTSQAAVAATCEFFSIVQHHVGPEFLLTRSVLMWQTGILLFVRDSIAPLISGVESGAEATGVTGLLPNKGGTAVMLRVGGTSLCFVGCHLAAHMKHVEQRNRNAAEILNGIRAGVWAVDIDQQHHHCFWMGDMNYRIDPGLLDGTEPGIETPEKAARVSELISGSRVDELLAADQLHHYQAAGKVLVGFSEAPITFLPTFKVAREAGFHYKNQRISSYCDRVLWKSQPALAHDVRCKFYSAFPEIASSDHKPVAAAFEVDCFPELALSAQPAIPGLIATDSNGLADPFACFFCEPDVFTVEDSVPRDIRAAPSGTSGGGATDAPKPSKSVAYRSAVKPMTLSPAWSEADVPVMTLGVTSSAQLARVHLMIALMDKDVLKNDRMGSVIVPLSTAARSGVPFSFSLPLVRGGCRAGTLAGQLQIVWPQFGSESSSLDGSKAATKASARASRKCCVQ